MSILHPTVLLVVTLFVINTRICFAQEEQANVSELAENRYALFAKQAALIDLRTKGSDRQLQIREQPLQKFSASGNTFGSVFLWKTMDGRPATIGTIGMRRGGPTLASNIGTALLGRLG